MHPLFIILGIMLLLAYIGTLSDKLSGLYMVAMVLGIGAIVALVNTGDKRGTSF